jgi:sugar/nucleoside kinase (ribokinase family)
VPDARGRRQVACVGHVTLEDVVLSSGRTAMGQIGGAAVFAAVGARVAGVEPTLVAKTGEGFPQRLRVKLSEFGVLMVDGGGEPGHLAQWVLYEADGSRQFVLHPHSVDHLRSAPTPEGVRTERLPAVVHLAPMPVAVQAAWLNALSAGSGQVTLDTADVFLRSGAAELLELLPRLTAFLPSELEARMLHGSSDMVRAARDLLALGPAIVAVKLGAEGSLVAVAGEEFHVPALTVDVVDVTGAGDAYCGGFAAGLSCGASALRAVRIATTAAAVTVQQFGALSPLTAGRSRFLELLRMEDGNEENAAGGPRERARS